MRRGSTPLSTLHVLSVPAYVTMKALKPKRKIECTRAWMTRKSPNVQFTIHFSTWNVGSMSWKSGEKCEPLKRRYVDICCLQEVRWKGQGPKMIGNGFNFLWGGGCKAENDLGVILGNWLIWKIVRVERFNDKMIKVNIVYWGCSLVGCILLLSTGW